MTPAEQIDAGASAGSGVWVDTATGSVFLPDGVPEWVTQNIIEQAGGLGSPGAQPSAPGQGAGGSEFDTDLGQTPVAPFTTGTWVQTATGEAYIPPGVPSWVRDSIIEQAGGLIEQTARPSQSYIPPVASAPPPAGPAGQAPPPGIFGGIARLGGLGGLSSTIGGIANGLAASAGAAANAILPDLKGIASGILNVTRGVIDALVPTISELALGLTNKFADLAGFIGGNLASIADFTEGLATGMASGMSVVFDGAWEWLTTALAQLMNWLGAPARGIFEEFMFELPSPAL